MNSHKSLENYLLIDNRNNPGMGSTFEEKIGMPCRGVVEMATLTCQHCTQQVLLNPNRERPRNYCRSCNAYICDNCAAIAQEPDYVHRPWKEVVDLVTEGKAVLLPGSTHGRPLLLFIK